MKSLFGAAIVLADIIAGTAAPGILAELRKPHAHPAAVITAVIIYAVLVAATLWVVMSVAGTASAGKKPAPRAGYPFGGSR